MVTTRYSDEQGSKSPQNLCEVQPTENIGNLSGQDNVLGCELQVLLFGVLPVFQNLNYKLQRRLSDVLPIQHSHQK